MRFDTGGGRMNLTLGEDELKVMEILVGLGREQLQRQLHLDLFFFCYCISQALHSGGLITIERVHPLTSAVERRDADHDDISRIISLAVKISDALTAA